MSNNNYLNKIRIGNEDVDIHDIRNLAASGTDGGAALKTGAIPFGIVDSTSTATAFTATVDGITELTNGTCVLLKNGVVTSAAGFTIDINNLGAHPVFNNLSAATAETTIFNVNYTMLFVYDSTRVVGESTGAWCCYRGYDSNTNTMGYQLRSNSYTKDMADRTYRYRILFSSADNSKWVPSNTSTSTSATASKTVCQTPINPFGEIVYYGTTASVAAGSRPAATSLWQQYTLALGYSFNKTGAALTLTSWEPVYVKCAPQANGSAIIDSTTPYVQSLPSTDDGKIYIFLGVAYSATNIELLMNHPVFYYKDGAIRQWSNQYIPLDSAFVHTTGNESIQGQKTFSDKIITNGGISSENSQDFSYITTGGGNTLQAALDAKPDIFIIKSTSFSASSSKYYVDKTFDEIMVAYNARKPIFFVDNENGCVYSLSYYDEDNSKFIFYDVESDDDLTSTSIVHPDTEFTLWAYRISIYVDDTVTIARLSHGNIDISLYAKLNSPTFTGTPGAPTASAGTNTTQIATTAFVQNAVNNLTSNLATVATTGSYNDLLNKPTIPNDSNLVHKTGNETINGIKTFNGNIKTSQHSLLEHHVPELISGNTLKFDWIKIHADLTDDDLTLQQALDERNNVQADWNQTTTTAADYIKNKPYIKSKRGGEPETMVTKIGQLETDDWDHRVEINSNYFRVYTNYNGTNYNGHFLYNNKEVAVKDDIPTNVSAFTNDAGYLTSYTETDPTVPAWAKASTKPTYTAAEVGALPDTTIIPDAPGTLNTNNSTAQTVSSSESFSRTIKLHKISKTGSYNDLLNKPTIPAVDIALTNNEIDTIWNNVMN